MNFALKLILWFHPPWILHAGSPKALKEPQKKELVSLVEQGIIAKVTEPTDWVNSVMFVTKSTGALRLCLDPEDFNRATKRLHYFTLTLEVVLPRLNGAKWVSILDARSGYWNIKLDTESSLYTPFNSPFGRYRFLRLPFGMCPRYFPKKGWWNFRRSTWCNQNCRRHCYVWLQEGL